MYINSTSTSGGSKVSVTKVPYPGTSTSLLLSRRTHYTIVASSFKERFDESLNNPQVSVYGTWVCVRKFTVLLKSEIIILLINGGYLHVVVEKEDVCLY